MLTWNDTPQKDQAGKVLSVSYKAGIPHWGEASIHPHIHHPGEMLLDCPGLGMDGLSRGTKYVIDNCKKRNIPVEIHLLNRPLAKLI